MSVEQRVDALLPGAFAHQVEHIGRSFGRTAVDQQHTLVRMKHGDVAAAAGDDEQALAQLGHGERRARSLVAARTSGCRPPAQTRGAPLLPTLITKLSTVHRAPPREPESAISFVSSAAVSGYFSSGAPERAAAHAVRHIRSRAAARVLDREVGFARHEQVHDLVTAAARRTMQNRATVVSALVDVRAGSRAAA